MLLHGVSFFIFSSAFLITKLSVKSCKYIHWMRLFLCEGFIADGILMLVLQYILTAISIFFLTTCSMIHRCFNPTYGLAKQLVASLQCCDTHVIS